MLNFRQMDASCAPLYDNIPMQLTVTEEYKIEKIDRGLGGFRLRKTPVTPYEKTFDDGIADWQQLFDLSNWAFFMAFDDEKPIGGAVVASRTQNVHMLSQREDLAVLWDIRVCEGHKHEGIGQRLFDMAADWVRAQGLVQLKIECQHNNVPAVNFYHKQGAVLCEVNEYAYYNEPEYRNETQLIWYLDL